MTSKESGRALVTGASRGIGRAIARRLAGDYEIIAAARSRDDLDSLASEIRAAGGRCTPLVLDVADATAVQSALGPLDVDVIVNNAGLGVLKPMMELAPDEWHRMIDVNLNALFHVTRALLPGMLERGKGDIVIIGSIAGRNTFAGGTAYTATKHAVMGFAESLLLEVRDRGVRVTVVMPGSVDTEFGGAKPTGEPNWRLRSEDVAETVAFILAQPRSVTLHRVEVRASQPAK